MCLMAADRMSNQLQDFKYMAESIGLCDSEDGAYDYEMELLRLEGLVAECRGLAAFAKNCMKQRGYLNA